MARGRAADIADERGKGTAAGRRRRKEGEGNADAIHSPAAAGAENGTGTIADTGGGALCGGSQISLHGAGGPAAAFGRGRRLAIWPGGADAPTP